MERLFLALLSLYRASTKPDGLSFVFSTPGIVFLASAITFALFLGWLIRALPRSSRLNRRQTYMAISVHFVTLALLIGSLEMMARFASKQTASGETLLGSVLYPKNWLNFSHYYHGIIDEMRRDGSYLMHDENLGWTILPSRRDKTGLQLSSAEGLRSPIVGLSFADLRTRHSGVSEVPASVRVALIGDSMTFGHEVRCEESWGHILEMLLQPYTQVLNFGVGAHSMSQTYERYQRDVRSWKPQIVVVGITSSMITRNNNIYPFLKDPEWGFPLARPRLITTNGVLKAVNYPVADPQQTFSHEAVEELPYLEYDDYYRSLDWERGGVWHLIEKSYVFRFINSIRPPSDGRQEDRNRNALQASEPVLEHLIRRIKGNGSVPLVVYLPYSSELSTSAKPQNNFNSLSIRMLQNLGINYFDPSSCLRTLDISQVYMKESHYSPQANNELARCLKPVLQEIINGLQK